MYNLLSGIPLNIDIKQIALHLLNFVLLFLILYFLLYKPVKKFMEKREAHYREQDERSNARLAEAEQSKLEYEKRLNQADEEIADKKRAVISEARAESERIIKSAENESAVILKKAGDAAENIKKRAEERVKDELADVIAAAATEKIEKSLSIDAFLSENTKDER